MSVPDILPPSPPTTSHRDRIYIPMAFKPSMSTPDDSPASFIPSSGGGSRKRVEFSPWPNVVDPVSSTPVAEMAILKTLPPSRECHKNAKSILKPYNGINTSRATLDGINEVQSACPEVLEAIAQQLSNNNKGSSLDAYQTLSQVIKAYDEIPEDVNTRSHIAAILRSIKRDLSMQDQTHSSPIDTSLMTQALKVSVILVWSEHFSPLLTDEFRIFIIERSISAVAEHTAPKVIIIHYMHLLAMQNFRSSIMANTRAVRLLEALQDITNHVQGKGAISERLLIYHKLIEQTKPLMKAKASLWIREVFLGLASSVKDIRDKAIAVGTKACSAFPSSPTISTAAREALASIVSDKTGNDRTVNAILTQRLEKMVAAKDEATQVPQIWALGILLCNNNDIRLNSWSLLCDWLRVIQRCFNCSDTAVRAQTFPAWNRFIHISRPHEASDNVVSILAKPIIVQIERTSSSTSGKGLRPAAISSYCMLLYHAFRAAASHRQYTRMWNEYIVKIMGSDFLSKSSANADLCSRIVMSLMWKDPSSSRVWNENRAHENSLMEPEELPSIDCKWIRSKTEAILQLFRVMFRHSVWGPSVQCSDKAYVARAWRHFIKAICESASKEIKSSTETRKALSHIIQFIQEMYAEDNLKPKVNNLEGPNKLIFSIAIAELGSIQFLDAMEHDPNSQSALMLDLFLGLEINHLTFSEQHTVMMNSRPQTVLTKSLQKCLKVLDHSLQLAYEKCDAATSSTLYDWIRVAFTALAFVSKDITFPFLDILQHSLILIVVNRDDKVISPTEPCSFEELRLSLSKVIGTKIVTLRAPAFEQLDSLIAAVLSNCGKDYQINWLKTCHRNVDLDTEPTYGPQVTEIIKRLHTATEMKPVVTASLVRDPETPIRGDLMRKPMIIDGLAAQVIEPVIFLPAPHAVEQVELDKSKSHTRITPEHDFNAHRPRYDDSQIYFAPVPGSPSHLENIESQFLTDRQKEVRHRQRDEAAVTFSDLRSSPTRPCSNQGSRAASADCEIARKAAAIQSLPSTPEISRQQDIVDEDELPTPTPKSRQRVVNTIEVDIPSSPPSVIGDRRSTVDGNELPSSPFKAPIEADVDMVDLSDEILPANPIEVSGNTHHLMQEETLTTEPSETTEELQAESPTWASSNVIPSTHKESGLASVVDESAQEPKNSSSNSGVLTSTRDGAIGHDHDTDNDELDELSASQLSQSLESFIAEEARQSNVAANSPVSKPTTSRRRKRPVSGYADQDGKKRRKRTSPRNEVSYSSTASDEFITVDEHAELMTVVGSTPRITNANQQFKPEADLVANPSYVSATSTLTRNRYQQNNRSDPLSLQFKSPTPHSVEVQATTPTSSPGESSKASTQVLNESVYESIIKPTAIQSAERDTEKSQCHNTPLQTNEEPNNDNTNLTQAEPPTNYIAGIMTALKSALNGLRTMNKTEHANIDLKAIDDLCFNIRYQAQEIVNGRHEA